MLVIAAALLACVACSEEAGVPDAHDANSADAGQVVVYSTHGDNIVNSAFDAYTAETGVKIILLSGDFQSLTGKIRQAGRYPVADLFIAGNGVDLWQAGEQNLFRPNISAAVNERVPNQLRDPEHLWVSLAARGRIVIYNTELTSAAELGTIVDYASLGEPRWRGRLCLSSSGNAGNRSLIAMLVNDNGVRPAELLVRGWRSNLAAPVLSDDSNLLQAVAAGRCGIGIADSSELARFQRANAHARIAPFWFSDPGVLHVDVTGAGKLLEWLTSDAANALFAALTLEFPLNPGSTADASIAAWSGFEPNPVSISRLGYLQEDALELAQRAQYP